MNKRRWRFYAALALFAIWVAALGVMAVVSGEKPANPKGRQAAQPR